MENDKKKCISFLKDYLEANPNTISNQRQIVELVNDKLGISIKQSTASRYLKQLGYSTKNQNGYWQSKINPLIKAQKEFMIQLLKLQIISVIDEQPESNKLYMSVQLGYESMVATLFQNSFEDLITGVLVGKKMIMLFFDDVNKIPEINQFLSNY